jgi:beta-lactamase regulating signal transducer with metallopeptidase domain
MIVMKTELLRVCDAVLTAGLNGVLQGLFLLLLLMLGARCFGRRMNATTRHAVYLVTLLFLVLLVPANALRHFLVSQKSPPAQTTQRAEDRASHTAPMIAENMGKREAMPESAKPRPFSFVFLPLSPEHQELQLQDSVRIDGAIQVEAPTNIVFQAVGPGSFDQGIARTEFLRRSGSDETLESVSGSLFDNGSSSDSESHSSAAADTVAAASSRSGHGSGPEPSPFPRQTAAIPPLAEAIIEAASVIESTASDEEPTIWDNLKAAAARVSAVLFDPISFNLAGHSWLPARLSLTVLAGCSMLAAYRLGLVGSRLRRIRRLKADCTEATPDLTALFLDLCAQSKTKRTVTLGIARTDRSAVLLGFRHPKILLPAECDAQEAEPILRHELAHLHRRDDWTNLCQQLIHATFFFHPGVWWVCRRLSLEREIACDDCVLKQSSPRRYALLLATLAGRMQGSPALLAPGVSTNKSQLQQRIDMILDTKRNTSVRVAKTRLGLITSAAALAGMMGIYTAPRIVLAQSQDAPTAAPARPSTPASGAVLIAPAAAAPAAETISADEPTPIPAAPSVSPGPKYKGLAPVPAPAIPATPAAPGAAALPGRGVIGLAPVPLPPTAPTVFVTPVPTTAPLAVLSDSASVAATYEPASPPRHKDTSNMSIEERLNRLERMIESLSAQRTYKPWQPGVKPDMNFDFKWDGQTKMNGSMDQKQAQQLQEFARKQADMARKQVEIARQQIDAARQNGVDSKEIEKMKAQIERETARAREEMKRAARELERSMRDQQPHPKTPETRDFPSREKRKWNKDAKGQQLEGLRRQHESLERQMEKLDRQIEQLEQNQEELEEQNEDQTPEQAEVRSSDKNENNEVQAGQPKAECSDIKPGDKSEKPAAR